MPPTINDRRFGLDPEEEGIEVPNKSVLSDELSFGAPLVLAMPFSSAKVRAWPAEQISSERKLQRALELTH